MITIFHKPAVASSSRALALLKQFSAQASETATEDQASDHTSQNKLQRSAFELDVKEDPPTGDQLRSIFEYVGDAQAKGIVKGSTSVSDAIKLLQEDKGRFQAPVVSLYFVFVLVSKGGGLGGYRVVGVTPGASS